MQPGTGGPLTYLQVNTVLVVHKYAQQEAWWQWQGISIIEASAGLQCATRDIQYVKKRIPLLLLGLGSIVKGVQ